MNFKDTSDVFELLYLPSKLTRSPRPKMLGVASSTVSDPSFCPISVPTFPVNLDSSTPSNVTSYPCDVESCPLLTSMCCYVHFLHAAKLLVGG